MKLKALGTVGVPYKRLGALLVLTVNPKRVEAHRIAVEYSLLTNVFRRYWIQTEWMMVVLRTSIIPFNGWLHKTLGEGIGTAPWSEALEKSLTPNHLEARGVGYNSTEAHKLHKMA